MMHSKDAHPLKRLPSQRQFDPLNLIFLKVVSPCAVLNCPQSSPVLWPHLMAGVFWGYQSLLSDCPENNHNSCAFPFFALSKKNLRRLLPQTSNQRYCSQQHWCILNQIRSCARRKMQQTRTGSFHIANGDFYLGL
mmetsp:Transcript_7912/g.22045  ORF Transcript_7912/g.22045 Transcript_7912/m.22045 type:complete len:136 (-) Transcript_7912:1838-2245(-)